MLSAQENEGFTHGDTPEPPRYLREKTHEELVAMQQKARHELTRYEDALHIATTVLSERRQ